MTGQPSRPFQFTTRTILILTTLVAIWLVLFGVFNWQSQLVLGVMIAVVVTSGGITRIAAITIAAAMLLPYSWVFWVPGPFSDYRMFWLSSWPSLPGLLPAHRWFMHSSEEFEVFMAALFTLAAWGLFLTIGRFGKWWLILLTVMVAAGSVLMAFGSYAAFRA